MARALRILLAMAVALGATAVACRGTSVGGALRVVASMYPLAWAAQAAGGPRVQVEDLTPPGVEAHDTTLTANERADLQTADVVVLLGDLGFQPDIERAAREASGTVVAVSQGMKLQPSEAHNLSFDPHVWLDPVLMEHVVTRVTDAFAAADPEGTSGYERRAGAALAALRALDAAYRDGLSGCGARTFVVTHEAFGYLAARYGLTQLGIEGLTPESEPSAAAIQVALDAISSGEAAPAVFYEGTEEGRRIGESVAADAGVPALPMSTLEFAPRSGDYRTVMRANLTTLREGLRCR